jgi:hypothetical protein
VVISKELLSSVAFTAIGCVALFLSRGLQLGTTLTMGPGYFPTILGVALLLLGVIGIVQALVAQNVVPVGALATRQLILVPISIFVFGPLLERAGLVVAVTATTLIASMASPRVRPLYALLGAGFLVVLTCLLFIRFLGLPIAALPPGW